MNTEELRSAVTAVIVRMEGLGKESISPDDLELWRRRFRELPPVAIVVPIYNEAAKLEACLDSLLDTVSPDTQVLLIDDHGTDPRVGVLCRAFLEKHTNARFERNDQNYGWVVSSNRGIRLAEEHRDVVLLNSDTILTREWLERLRWAVASRHNVACASPLSNAAGVYSLPVAYGDAALPEAVEPDVAALLLDLASPRLYETVPCTCGFCLYFRRTAIDAVGLFDDRLFLRGYGEENDFCCRARSAGFINVCDDATFVAHCHGASFGTEKAGLKRRNGRILKTLFPQHSAELRTWEDSTALVRVRSAYGELLDAYLRTDDEGRAWLKSAGSVAFRETAGWSPEARAISMGPSEIDLFGLVRQPRLDRSEAALRLRWSGA